MKASAKRDANVAPMTGIELLSTVVAPLLFGKTTGDPVRDAHDVLNAGWPRRGGKDPLRPVQGQLLIATPRRVLTTVKTAPKLEVSEAKPSALLQDFVLNRLDEPTVMVMFCKTLTQPGSVFATVDPRHTVMTMDGEVWRFNAVRLREYVAAGSIPAATPEAAVARRWLGLGQLVEKEGRPNVA